MILNPEKFQGTIVNRYNKLEDSYQIKTGNENIQSEVSVRCDKFISFEAKKI